MRYETALKRFLIALLIATFLSSWVWMIRTAYIAHTCRVLQQSGHVQAAETCYEQLTL
jgi:putative effector of murein hydrolase LrgA (UPF0299 family)